MKGIFLKNLCIYMFLAFIITVVSLTIYQTNSAKENNTKSSYQKLEAVKEKLLQNDDSIDRLKDTLKQNLIAKTDAFAYIINQNPDIIQNKTELNKIRDFLQVDELHVTDGEGVIRWGTVDEYIGFDFKGPEQTKDFLPILTDSSIKVAQDPQPNGAEGKLFQYIGVSRIGQPGIIQVGVYPKVLEDMIKNNTISNVLSQISFGENGFVFAIDYKSGLIEAFSDESYIGKEYNEIGFSDKVLIGGEGEIVINDEIWHYVSEEYNNIVIGTLMPDSEYYSVRNSSIIVLSGTIFFMFIFLIIVISCIVNFKIIRGIQSIGYGLKSIEDGNLDTIISVNNNPELKYLSEKINEMVKSIKSNISKNKELMEKQEKEIEINVTLIKNIKSICKKIENALNASLITSQSINDGSNEQKIMIDKLVNTMDNLKDKLDNSAKTSAIVSKSSTGSVENMLKTKENMQKLSISMKEISDTSSKIEKIVKEIEDIATQTNMLSVNASIEAARAGENGKGFAVVALQIGELARMSTDAAKETTELIAASIDAVTKGDKIVVEAVSDFMNTVDNIEQSGNQINTLAFMAEEQSDEIINIISNLGQISKVASENKDVSENSMASSRNLADDAKILLELVGKVK